GRFTRTRSLARKQKAYEYSSPQVHRNVPALPARVVLTVSFVVSLAIGLFCHHHPQGALAPLKLDASVEASGRHNFSVRVQRIRHVRSPRPSHPAPNVRDDWPNAPLFGHGIARRGASDLPVWLSEIFSAKPLDISANQRAATCCQMRSS